jgi:DNA-binding NarL/FixJ family response regulator
MVAERYCLLPRPITSALTQEPLTGAEQQVLSYLCAGYSNKEIAQFLHKAEPTVKYQVSACLRKFGLSSRMRLIAALREPA